MVQTNSAAAGLQKYRELEDAGVPVRNAAGSVFKVLLFLFVADTLFDPADLLFGLKLPLYLLCWGAGFVVCINRRKGLAISIDLVLYCLGMIALPLISIFVYQLFDGRDQFEGFQLLKSYLFISMAVLLYVTRVNVLPQLAAALTMLSAAIIATAALVLLVPAMLTPAYVFGEHLPRRRVRSQTG